MELTQILCGQCALIELCIPQKETTVRAYRSLEELSKSAESGCAFCALVSTAHGCWDHGCAGKVLKIEISYGKLPNQDTIQKLEWRCKRENGQSANPLGEIYALPGEPIAKYIPYRPLGQDPRSAKCDSLIRGWIEECNTSHPNCVKSEDSVLPTRLIDVGWGQEPGDPRLCIPPTGSKGKYLALSYCWGKSHNVILTSGNLAERLKLIPMKELPLTIRDAVEVTRSLGLRYVWIDALCILQDSLEDWQKESARMCNTFGNAFLTIQAAGAEDTSKGCFLPRTTANPYDGYPVPGRPTLPPQPPVRLPFVGTDGSRGTVYIRFGVTPDELVVSPAQMRGWICQEDLLSPRILFFGAYKFFWECATAYHDESGAAVRDYGIFPGLPKPLRQLGPQFHGHENDLSREQKIWSYITGQYTHRQLTNPRDKLPALAGLARQISLTRPGDTYCAGLWRNDMPANLMWRVALRHDLSGGLVSGPLPFYRAPSWSWASWDGAVTPYDTIIDTDGICEVIEVTVTSAEHNPFGEVSAGKLKIRGLLKQGWRIYSREYQFQQILDRIDPLPAPENYLEVTKGILQVPYRDPFESENVPREAWFLRIQEHAGLALERLDDNSFRRIGRFSLKREKVWTPLDGWFTSEDLQAITIV